MCIETLYNLIYDTTRLAILCSKVKEHVLATEQSEGASYALETKVRNLIDGTTSGYMR